MRTQLYVLLLLVAFTYAARRSIPSASPKGFLPLDTHKRSLLQPENQQIDVTIAIAQRNAHLLEETFWAVSNPTNAKYGQHLSYQELIDLVAPDQASIDTVTSFLRSNGVPEADIHLHESKDFITVTLSVEQAGAIFQTTQTAYQSKRTGAVAMRMDSDYTLPDEVSSVVDFVSHFNKVPDFVIEAEELKPTRSARSARGAARPPRTNAVRSSPIDSGLSEYGLRSEIDATPIVVSVWAFTNFIQFSSIVYCLDGTYPQISSTDDGPTLLLCGSNSITSVEVVMQSNLTGNTLAKKTLDVSDLTSVSVCGSNYNCNETAFVYGYDNTSIYIEGKLYVSLPNYVPFSVQLTLIFEDASRSETGVSTFKSIECSEYASPEVIFRTYNIPSGLVVTQENNSQAVVEFASDSINVTDVQRYFEYFNITDYSDKIVFWNYTALNVSNQYGEAILDVECIMGVAQNATTFFWEYADETIDLIPWVRDILNAPVTPLVHSLSWGQYETTYPSDSGFSYDYQKRLNTEFMKAGARGISLITASGDDGSQSFEDATDYPGYAPGYPNTCPYITNVGATSLYSKDDPSCFVGDAYVCAPEEVAASPMNGAIISSSGGFSNIFARPEYQDEVVQDYLDTLSQDELQSGFNLLGRAFPDVSALGHNIYVKWQFSDDGDSTYFDGTSASSPIFAGMITLLNDIRLQAGRPPLGFLNPFLYSLPKSAYFDITRGNDYCEDTYCLKYGWSTAPGWDPVTGLGTPNFTAFAEAVRNLPDMPNAPTTAPTTAPTAPTAAPSPAPTAAPTAPTAAPTAPTTTPTTTPTAPTTAPAGFPVTITQDIVTSWISGELQTCQQVTVHITNTSPSITLTFVQITPSADFASVQQFWQIAQSGSDLSLPSYTSSLAPSSTFDWGYVNCGSLISFTVSNAY